MASPKIINPVGRPTIMTPQIIDKLEEAFAIGASDAEACFYADIGQSTLYKYQVEHPEFLERKDALKEKPVLQARQTVVKALKDNPEMAFKYLERKRKKEFAMRQEITGADGNPMVVEHTEQALTIARKYEEELKESLSIEAAKD